MKLTDRYEDIAEAAREAEAAGPLSQGRMYLAVLLETLELIGELCQAIENLQEGITDE